VNVVEASIADLRSALDKGETTSVELVAAYLQRIGGLDHHGPLLNSVPVLNPAAFQEARESDLRRSRGELLSPLDGIPYTAKDSYRVKGLPVSAGSPAFADLIAGEDAFSISRLRAAGAICLGLTTMPPMANGGMQRGLHGRAESPYNSAFLTSAWGSGSSNGSGTATAASFAAFGLGEETWSSGRAPANNNSLCAYTPSWGVISTRGNWPLVPSMDVVVPHARSMPDLLQILDVLVADDPKTRGDFWRVQTALTLPASSQHRPASYTDLTPRPLAGVRLGVPNVFINRPATDGGSSVATRPGVVGLFDELAAQLRAAGAELVACDLPALTAYEGSHGHLTTDQRPDGGFQGGLEDLGFLPRGYLRTELEDLAAWSLDDFLRANAAAGGTGPSRLTEVDPERVFPLDPGQIPDEYGEDFGMGDYVGFAASHASMPDGALPGPGDLPLSEGLRGLERARRELFDEWLREEGLDALIFPTSADIAPADADQDESSHDIAWRNGTWVANGNLLWRHLGIPTVTVPMGSEPESRMPFGATLAGAGGDDVSLLRLALAVEATAEDTRRVAPDLPEPDNGPGPVLVDVEGHLGALTDHLAHVPVSVQVDGTRVDTVSDAQGAYRVQVAVAPSASFHSHWTGRYGHVITVVAHPDGGAVGSLRIAGGC
jgi:amidase